MGIKSEQSPWSAKHLNENEIINLFRQHFIP